MIKDFALETFIVLDGKTEFYDNSFQPQTEDNQQLTTEYTESSPPSMAFFYRVYFVTVYKRLREWSYG